MRTDVVKSSPARSRIRMPRALSRMSIWTWLVVGATVLVASGLITISVGSVDLSLGTVIDVVLRRLGLIRGDHVTILADQIIWQMRLPRVLVAIAVGSSLAVCGAVLQTLMGNPLADPYLLGISSGASVGAVSVLVFGIGLQFTQRVAMTMAAFIGALVALGLVLALSSGHHGELAPSRTILAGVAVAQLCQAATSLMIMVFGKNNSASAAMSWSLGSLAGARWGSTMVVVAAGLISLLVVGAFSRTLDAFAFGDVTASSLGINVTRVRWLLLCLASLVTAVFVAQVGPIGFVGLITPHIARPLVGSNHSRVLPLSALIGGVIMLWSDTLARTIAGKMEIPIGIVTAIIGTPVLIILLRRQAKK